MTAIDWASLLTPLITVLVGVVASLLGLALTGITARLRTYLEARGHAEAANVLSEANDRVQTAMQNAAGLIALEIRTGKLDPTDLNSIKEAATRYAAEIARKMPDTLAKLQPASGALTDGVLGKVTTAFPAPSAKPATPATPPANDRTPALASAESYAAKAGIVVSRLMKDLAPLTREQASGIVGNLGEESGLREINEVHPISGRGGFGWAQWTAERRRTFEAWSQAQGLAVTDPEANYGFLVHELLTTEAAALAAVRATTTVEEATQVFEQKYERAGVVRMDRRLQFAQMALAA